MKKIFPLLFVLLIVKNGTAQNVGINTTTPNANAVLDIRSDTKGLLPPRLSTTAKNNMPNVPKGMLVYDTTASTFFYHDGNKWRKMSDPNYDSLLLDNINNPQVTANMSANASTSAYSGLLYDNGGPAGNYAANSDDQYRVLVSGDDSSIFYKIVVEQMNLESPYDTLEVYNNLYPEDRIVLSGTTTGTWYFPAKGNLYFNFKSNAVNQLAGFRIRWSRVGVPASSVEQAPQYGWYFNPQKVAMRGGVKSGNNWTTANLGYLSFAYGISNQATGNYSTAMGYKDTAVGTASVAIGQNNMASGYYSGSIAIGQNNNASSTYSSTAIGFNNIASSSYGSTAIGINNISNANYSTAIGTVSTASGAGSTAMGYITTASGDYSTVTGKYSRATGYAAMAMGDSAIASGNYSTAMGYRDTAVGIGSVAIGQNNLASGGSSTAMGNNTTASGYYSTTLGLYSIARGYSSTVIGMYNNPILAAAQTSISSSTPLFIIGNGDDNSNKNNAMVVLKSGNVGIGTNIPDANLHIRHASGGGIMLENSNDGNKWRIYSASGDNNLTFYNNAGTEVADIDDVTGTFSAISDSRLKKNIQSIPSVLPLVMKLDPSYYQFKWQKQDEQKQIGFIAQGAYKLFPELVSYSKEKDLYKMNYAGFSTVAIKAIQEQQIVIQEQQKQIDELKLKLEKLETIILKK